MKNRPLLEVCVDSPTGLTAAVDAGADRIELCAALALCGLTPSPGLMARAAAAAAPVHAMIRPRPGDFLYSPSDIDVMRRDIDAARSAGLAGVVFGALRATGDLDEAALEVLLRRAEGLSVTLHRAFDLTADLEGALQTAISLGFDRVLTSGGASSATEGAEQITDLVAQAAGRIVVMAGAGLTPRNVAALARRTGVREVHASCSGVARPVPAQAELDGRSMALGFQSPDRKTTQPDQVAEMLKALHTLD